VGRAALTASSTREMMKVLPEPVGARSKQGGAESRNSARVMPSTIAL